MIAPQTNRRTTSLDFTPKQRMTRWYEPLAMFRLLLRIWSTRQLTKQRDQADEQPVITRDYASETGDFWFDYVADLGDAFDPTMCVAWHLGRRELRRADIDPRLTLDPALRGPMPGALPMPEPPEDDIPEVLPRGRLLLMGGDEVYPDGSIARYRNQVVGPYQLAFEGAESTNGDDKHGAADDSDSANGGDNDRDNGSDNKSEQGEDAPDLLALPANHDWYGGLGPFSDTFCRGRDIGGWRTTQGCSWWAARLAHGWWVWGVDTALDGTVNDAQYQYFRRVRREMSIDDRLIVCLPVPVWRLRERYIDRYDNLGRFFLCLGVEPEVYLSGDYHIAALHRRDGPDAVPEWHVTSGGGGAFQHPVHNLDRRIPNQYGGLPEPTVADAAPLNLIATWPSNAESREGTGGWWHILFDRAAVSLIATLAAIQLPFLWLAGVDNRTPADNSRSVGQTLADQLWPTGALFSLALIASAMFGLARATSNSRGAMSWARAVGFGHGVVQSVVFAASWLVGNLLVRRAGAAGSDPPAPDPLTASPSVWVTWLILVAVAAGAGVLAIVVLGSYLRFANRQFRMHDNESYSARHSGDNRNFARFRIAPDGSLSCYLIAFRHTGSRWADAFRSGSPVPPEDTSDPELINVRFRTAPSEFPYAPGTADAALSSTAISDSAPRGPAI
ncbi:MAG: hypothetical protein AAF531_15980 [Actinomycetota bacterium]